MARPRAVAVVGLTEVAPPRTVLVLHSSAGLYGADVQLLAIARGLDPARWRAVCVLPEDGPLSARLRDGGVEVVLHPLAVLRRSTATPRGAVALARATRRDASVLGALAREHGVALVHDNTSVILSGGAVARRAGAAHLTHVREIYAGVGGRAGQLLWPLMRRRLLRAGALACISEAVRAQFGGAENALLLRDGLSRPPAPIPAAQARAVLGLPSDRFVVALVGRISDWKGQDVLARALAEPPLSDIGAIGLMAGDDLPGSGEAARLDALAVSLGLGDRLRRLGFCDDVDTVLGAADAVAVPSTRPEPLGLVALEGMAAGLPVVASAAGGLPELVRDGETGLLVRPGDHAALAIALAQLAANPERATAMGVRGARDVAQRFSADQMLAELQGVYDRLAG